MIPIISFRGIVPILGPDPFEAAMIAVVKQEMDIAETLFRRVHATWSAGKQPEWGQQLGMRGGSLVGVLMTTTNYEIISHLNYGTKKDYPIPARSGGYLHYQKKFRPKTRKRFLGSTGGGKFGDEWTTRKVVTHPGIEAREWDVELARLRQPFFAKSMTVALTRASHKFFTGSKTTR